MISTRRLRARPSAVSLSVDRPIAGPVPARRCSRPPRPACSGSRVPGRAAYDSLGSSRRCRCCPLSFDGDSIEGYTATIPEKRASATGRPSWRRLAVANCTPAISATIPRSVSRVGNARLSRAASRRAPRLARQSSRRPPSSSAACPSTPLGLRPPRLTAATAARPLRFLASALSVGGFLFFLRRIDGAPPARPPPLDGTAGHERHVPRAVALRPAVRPRPGKSNVRLSEFLGREASASARTAMSSA